MTGMPASAAFLSTVTPPSLDSGTMMRTLAPRLIRLSARLANRFSSPSAFSMTGSTPANCSACASMGRSCSSQRVDEARSGRITPTTGRAAATVLVLDRVSTPDGPHAVSPIAAANSPAHVLVLAMPLRINPPPE